MTRKKKSRKVAQTGTPRLSKEKLLELRALKDQRKKKSKGAKAGSRNAPEALKEDKQVTADSGNKDKRLGSKKLISLKPEAAKPESEAPKMMRHLKPQVELKEVKPSLTPEQELEQLENDPRLMKLLEQHERGELITGKDAKFFNRSVARHQELCELLGIDDEFEEDDIIEDDPLEAFMSDDLASEWFDDDDEEDDYK
jgi:ribosome assembly protein YihI (activator of Der GTPase)